MAIAYIEAGKGRKQDAEALFSSDSLSLKHMEVLNVENARSYFLLRPDFPQNLCSTDFSRIKPISKGLFKIVMSC
jgi:hypothetical protein